MVENYIYIRSQHGIRFHELPSTDYYINRGYDKFQIKYHRTFTEVLYTFYENNSPNSILFLIYSPISLSPKRIVQLLDKVVKLTWADDFVYVKMTTTGKIVDWLKISCPTFYLEHVDPVRDKDKIARDCDILIYSIATKDYRYFWDLLLYYCLYEEDDLKRDIIRVVELVKEMGDDLLYMTFRYDVEKFLEEYEYYIYDEERLKFLHYLLNVI